MRKGWVFGLTGLSLIIGLLITLQAICWTSEPAAAQSAFCQPGQTFENGFCVNKVGMPSHTSPTPVSGGMGTGIIWREQFACVGLPGAAAQSQTLDATLQATAQQSLDSTRDSVLQRREEAAQACPADYRRINGVCEPIGSNRALGYAPEQDLAANMSFAADMSHGRMVLKAPPASTVARANSASHLGAVLR